MKTTRHMLALAAMMSLGSIVPVGAEEDFPTVWPDPPRERARKGTGGNTPVPGGGARERERRLRKMSQQQS